MTLPPELIGDKGQRYIVSALDDEGHALRIGYSDTLVGARGLGDAMRLHPTFNRPMIVDRRPDPVGVGTAFVPDAMQIMTGAIAIMNARLAQKGVPPLKDLDVLYPEVLLEVLADSKAALLSLGVL